MSIEQNEISAEDISPEIIQSIKDAGWKVERKVEDGHRIDDEDDDIELHDGYHGGWSLVNETHHRIVYVVQGPWVDRPSEAAQQAKDREESDRLKKEDDIIRHAATIIERRRMDEIRKNYNI